MRLGWFSSKNRRDAGADLSARNASPDHEHDYPETDRTSSRFRRLFGRTANSRHDEMHYGAPPSDDTGNNGGKALEHSDAAARGHLSFPERLRAVDADWFAGERAGHLPRYQPEPARAMGSSARADTATSTPVTGHLHDAHRQAGFADRHGARHGRFGYDERQGPSRTLVGDLTRLGAAVFTAGLCGLMIANSQGDGSVVDRLAGANPLAGGSLSDKACRAGQPVLTSDFTQYDNVLSVSPLGAVTAPGEILPVPYIRINTKNDGSPFERRATDALAPATADIVALERRLIEVDGKSAPQSSWTVYMQPCAGIEVVYDRLDNLSAAILEKAGGLVSFSELGGPQHLAKQTSIRISAGMVIGTSDGFDVALHDNQSDGQTLARPERYHRNNYARAALFNVAPELLDAVTPDITKAQCALDYLRSEDRDAWSRKLGDAWGIRRAKGDNACRTALIDLPGTAQGAWFTDAAHNGATTKISAIALAPDTINPDRLIFALHGRLTSLTEDMIGSPRVSKASVDSAGGGVPEAADVDFVTFEKGSGLINRSFDEIRDDQVYCYENLRVNFIGARITGVILLQKSQTQSRDAAGNPVLEGVLHIEARPDLSACVNLPLTATLSSNATGFFR